MASELLEAALSASQPGWDNREIAKLLCLCQSAFGWSAKQLFQTTLSTCAECVDAEFLTEWEVHEVTLGPERLLALVEATARGFDALCDKVVMLLESGALRPEKRVCRELLAAVVDAEDETGKRVRFAARLCECLSSKKLAGKLLKSFCTAGSTPEANADLVADVVTRDFFLDLEGPMESFTAQLPEEVQPLLQRKLDEGFGEESEDSDANEAGNLEGFVVEDDVDAEGGRDARRASGQSREKPFSLDFTDSDPGASEADSDSSESDSDADSDANPVPNLPSKKAAASNPTEGSSSDSSSSSSSNSSGSEEETRTHLDLSRPTTKDEPDDGSDDDSDDDLDDDLDDDSDSSSGSEVMTMAGTRTKAKGGLIIEDDEDDDDDSDATPAKAASASAKKASKRRKSHGAPRKRTPSEAEVASPPPKRVKRSTPAAAEDDEDELPVYTYVKPDEDDGKPSEVVKVLNGLAKKEAAVGSPELDILASARRRRRRKKRMRSL